MLQIQGGCSVLASDVRTPEEQMPSLRQHLRISVVPFVCCCLQFDFLHTADIYVPEWWLLVFNPCRLPSININVLRHKPFHNSKQIRHKLREMKLFDIFHNHGLWFTRIILFTFNYHENAFYKISIWKEDQGEIATDNILNKKIWRKQSFPS